ncbi:MAG: sulfite exporter TauE/SafE family protein [Methylococcaceae bacterium]|jgi:hypothetical protein
MLQILGASVLLGMVSGVLAGLFGIGGGLVIVPVLLLLFTYQGFSLDHVMVMAVATSLATIMLTALASIWAHHRLGSMLWQKVLALLPGILLGSILGAYLGHFLSSDVLRIIFIVFLLYVGLKMALQLEPKAGRLRESKLQDAAVAILIGVVSALIGIGGGTMTVPYLVRSQYSMRHAVAVSCACGLPIAIGATLSYVVLGWRQPELPEWSLGYVYLPAFLAIGFSSLFTAPLGAKLAHRLPAKKLKKYFSVLLFLMAAKMIWG